MSTGTHANGITRRAVIGAGLGAAGLAASSAPSLAQGSCPPREPRVKGPLVFLDYDQQDLDDAYNQEAYQPITEATNRRLAGLSSDLRFLRGSPERHHYGARDVEALDFYRAGANNAPIFIFVHGGTWRFLNASSAGFIAEMFLDAGAHFAALDFSDVRTVGGDLGVLADQVRRGIAWIAQNAASLGVDPHRIYIGGFSSGGHLCGVALITDWVREFGLPSDVVKGALCISGMYDMAPVRLSFRREFVTFTDEMEDLMSPQRHIDRLGAPVIVSYGTLETPEFQRQSRDFAAAVAAAGHKVELIVGLSHYHQDMWASLGNPYGVNGRAALAMMGLTVGGR